MIASNILRELSINQNWVRASRRMRMEVINSDRLGRKQAANFFRNQYKILKTANKRR
jgi:hypothetical protein